MKIVPLAWEIRSAIMCFLLVWGRLKLKRMIKANTTPVQSRFSQIVSESCVVLISYFFLNFWANSLQSFLLVNQGVLRFTFNGKLEHTVQSRASNWKKIQETSAMIFREYVCIGKHIERNFSFSTRNFWKNDKNCKTDV